MGAKLPGDTSRVQAARSTTVGLVISCGASLPVSVRDILSFLLARITKVGFCCAFCRPGLGFRVPLQQGRPVTCRSLKVL